MEKKYPVIKCNEELWDEIKPVLESFGITNFKWIDNFEKYPFLISNHGFCDNDKLAIGNTDDNKIDMSYSIRYLVNTKEEFLSAVAKLLGKEYPIKEEIKQFNRVIKYPCIKCTQQLYDRIKDILIDVEYKNNVDEIVFDFVHNPYLVINYANKFGIISNIKDITKPIDNRYICSDIREFLTVACELQNFKVSYINNTEDNDSKNHYFRYCANKETKTISIYENKEEAGLQTIVLEKSVIPKNNTERYIVNYDPAIGKDSTIVANIPIKGNDFDNNKKDMEKINIADKLKHCKKGTKLYSPLFGEVKFNNIYKDKIFVITCNTSEIDFCKDGRRSDTYPDAECLLFPSKDNRDWNNFKVLEEGHKVMCSNNGYRWELLRYKLNNLVMSLISELEINYKYIVPVEDFYFNAEDITVNKEKSIV